MNHDLLEVSQPLSGSVRFLTGYFMPDHALYAKARYAAELERAEQAVLARPGADALAARGRLLRIIGRSEPAAADFEAALALEHDHPRALAYRGELNLVRDPRAALDLDRAIEILPGQAPFHLWRAYSYFLFGDWSAARGELDQAAALDPASVCVRLFRGILRQRSGDAAGAVEDFSAAIRLDPASPGLRTLRAAAQARLGAWPEAVEDAHAALDLHPENMDAFIALLQEKAGFGRLDPRQEKAVLVAAVARILREDPGCAWAYAVQAEVNKRFGDSRFEQSCAELAKAVELDPSRAWMWAFLGRALTLRQDTAGLARGQEKLEQAERLAGGIGWIHAWKGQVLHMRGRRAEALAQLDEAVRLDPSYRLSNSWRGVVRLEVKDFRGAEADLSAALEVRAGNAWTYYQRALARRELGMSRPMLADFSTAVELFSKYRVLATGLDRNFPNRFRRWADGLRWEAGISGPWSARARRLAGRMAGDWFAGLPERRFFNKAQAGGDFIARLSEAEAVEKAHPDDPLGPLWKGRALLNLGRPLRAREALNAALKLKPSALAFAWRGEAFFQLGLHRDAEADFSRALRLSPGDGPARAFRASARARLGRVERALADLLAAARRDPHHASLYRQWALMLLDLAERGGAKGNLALRRFVLAELALYVGDAAAVLQACGAEDSTSVRLRSARGLALAQTGAAGQSQAVLAAAVASAPEACLRVLKRWRSEIPAMNEAAAAALNLAVGSAFMKKTQWAEACEAFTSLLEFRPEDGQGRLSRGECLLAMNDAAGALEDLNQAVRLSPEKGDGYFLRARARLSVGDGERALTDLVRAAELSPADAEIRFWLGQTYFEKKEYAPAEAAFGQAVDLDGGKALAWVGRAMARKEQGDLEGSLRDFERARGLAPELFAQAAAAEKTLSA